MRQHIARHTCSKPLMNLTQWIQRQKKAWKKQAGKKPYKILIIYHIYTCTQTLRGRLKSGIKPKRHLAEIHFQIQSAISPPGKKQLLFSPFSENKKAIKKAIAEVHVLNFWKELEDRRVCHDWVSNLM